MKWLCQIRKKQDEKVVAYNVIMFRVFLIGASYCNINGDHNELTVSIGPLGFSFGVSLWRTLLP